MDETGELVSSTPEKSLVRLADINYRTPERTEKEKAEGMPEFKNEGILGVKIDREAIAQLLREEGLTPQQINALEITFRHLRIQDVDFAGDLIGGVAGGNKINLFTSFELRHSPYGQPLPEVMDNRYLKIVGSMPGELFVENTLHELKHYSQYCKGVVGKKTWWAASQEEHDQEPNEIEADQFMKENGARFRGKIEAYDPIGIFEPLGTFLIDRSEQKDYMIEIPPGLEEMKVARLMEDTPENDLVWDFYDRAKKMSDGIPLANNQELFNCLNEGRNLVDREILSIYEYNLLASRLAKTALDHGDLIAESVVASSLYTSQI